MAMFAMLRQLRQAVKKYSLSLNNCQVKLSSCSLVVYIFFDFNVTLKSYNKVDLCADKLTEKLVYYERPTG